VSREDSVQAAIAAALRRFGRIDVLYNCAGGSLSEDSYVTDVDLDKVWNHTMSIDLRGTILCCRHGIPVARQSGRRLGRQHVVGRGSARRSNAHIYTAAKGAILSLTRALAGAYVKHGVRANAICAGRILTERIMATYGTPAKAGPVADRQDAAGRVKEYPFWVGQPEDIANIALFLASDESRMITGATIPADGGRSAYEWFYMQS
jgi:NAD(P)-dependent dehydrogenase (short-subunit alcohol dehydrogenase family)